MSIMTLSGKTGKSKLILGGRISNLEDYCKADTVVLVTDKNVLAHYGGRLSKFDLIEVGAGETAKTLDTVHKIYEEFLKRGINKSSLVVGVGGGVVCDVTGFAASTYLRGVGLGFVPTTLLAQVDASIGGKNGVNLNGYKNLIGTIRQPRFCLLDFELLKTLPKRELASGLAEIAKCGAIADPALFGYLEREHNATLSLNKAVIERIVRGALEVKIKAVEADEFENEERMKLNFGHTIGHAIEKVARLSHGDAISMGMVAAAELSVSMGLIPVDGAKRLEVLLKNLGLPTRFHGDKRAILDAVLKDKKIRGEEINMILLAGIGKAVIKRIRINQLESVLSMVSS